MVIAQGQSATGSVFITGGQLSVTNQGVSLGTFGTGQLSVTIAGFGVGQMTVSNGSLLAQSVIVADCENSQGTLTIAGGAVAVASNVTVGAHAYIGVYTNANASGAIQMTSGSLTVTNQSAAGQLVIGQNGTATFLQSGGTATVDQLLVTNGTSSVFSLNSGLFNTRATAVSNAQTFFVGDGADPATYHLLAGIHSFANGVEVRSNAVLSGCGTINGAVLVDPGGLVQADCGGTLTFTGIVTNNGELVAANGSTVESYGLVVNDGVINIINGNTNFHAGFINNGVVLTSNVVPQIISITAVGSNIEVQFTTASNLTYVLEYTGNLLTGSWLPLAGFSGPGGDVTVTDFNAILQTQRFYRIHLVVPP